MIAGLDAAEHAFIERQVVAPLRAAGHRVWCFGSRARGDASGFSDVDLLVSPATSGSAAGARTARALIGAIREQLEESRFPYKVDLVYEPDLAEAYREAVTRERIALN
jgi:predicted nucleotidyltransferase